MREPHKNHSMFFYSLKYCLRLPLGHPPARRPGAPSGLSVELARSAAVPMCPCLDAGARRALPTANNAAAAAAPVIVDAR